MSENVLPKIMLKDLQNRNVSSTDLTRGKITLINFWASYCVPCRKEMPELSRIHNSYADQNVQVIGVSIDDTRTVGRVKSVVRQLQVDYPVVYDMEQKLYKHFNTKAMPFSILVDAQGRILWEHTGYIPGDEKKMEAQIKRAL